MTRRSFWFCRSRILLRRIPRLQSKFLPLVKSHLGLDDERSWIVVAEGNEFDWPGYDLRKIGRSDRYDYGFLPPRFFKQVIEAFAAWHRAHKVTLTSRE